MIRISCFLDIFLSKKRIKREIPDQFSGKSPCNKTTILAKPNGFFMRDTTCFFNRFLDKKRTKREISGRFSGKDPYNRTTVFPKRNGFL